MSGTVNIARALWDDPTFADGEMTQREAWIWLIAEASWKPRVKRFGRFEVDLNRGQAAVSTRFLAKAWQWSEPRVRRYLDMLKNRRMIECVTDAGVTVVTICNYDIYQSSPRVADAVPTQKPTRSRRTTDANENKGEIREEGYGGGEDTREALPTDREAILAAIGADPTSGLIGPNGRMLGTPADMAEVALWLDLPHLTIPVIAEEIRRIMGQKRDGPPKSFRYFTDAMRRLSGALDQAPLSPIAPPPIEGGTINAKHASDRSLTILAAGLSAGTVTLDTSNRDPFAKRSGQDHEPGERRAGQLLRARP